MLGLIALTVIIGWLEKCICPLLALPRVMGEGTMGQWLIADLLVADVHVQFWMLLVTGIVLFWFLYVWTTR